MSDCRNGHQPRRMRLNDWDDVTACSQCGHWVEVHHDVRDRNPNFENGRPS